ncbi:MAG: hypothetical protein EOO73_00080 [Myxococcales bacterium]|nr:MAG: hypothetical protein EOO73_00080 [Myxococcales bacterium]
MNRPRCETDDASLPRKARARLGRELARWAAIAGLAATLGCSGATTRQNTVESEHEPQANPAAEVPEDVWLDRIGTGEQQLARVCERGAKDRVATVLCDQSKNRIRSLPELYRALRLEQPEDRRVAVTTHSLSLSAKLVSSANPRVFVFAPNTAGTRQLDHEGVVATAFVRGEQLVELAALDPATYELNFYLLRFTQPCNEAGCTAEDLLTERIEASWTNWSLYSEHELQDTPLDCISCHRPFGAGSRKILLMRQVNDPWMHWGDFRGGDEQMCAGTLPDGVKPQVIATATGLDLLRALEGAKGRYAGVLVSELQAALSGENISDFLVDAENLVRASPVPPYPYEQLTFLTRETLCERFRLGTSPSWDAGRRESVLHGLPQPFYGPDLLDAEQHARLARGRAVLFEAGSSNSAFDVASSLISAEAAAAVGFVPREQDTAAEILRGMCVRCHSHEAEPGSNRARFNVEALDRIDPATFRAVSARLTLPKTSPKVMPPRRVGELPDWAISRVLDHLRDRCVEPGACP